MNDGQRIRLFHLYHPAHLQVVVSQSAQTCSQPRYRVVSSIRRGRTEHHWDQ